MKLWKILVATMIALVLVCAVAMAEETAKPCEHENGWYFMPRTVDFCKGLAVGDYRCRDCDAVVETDKFQTVPENHAYGEAYDKTSATCTKPASYKEKCALCGKVNTVEVGKKLGHVWGDTVTVEATCTENKYSYRPCEHGCGEITDKKVATGTKLNHNFQWVTTKPATCTEKGETTKKCINKGCGILADIEKPVEEIAAKGHKPVKDILGVVEKQPSCTETGLKTWTCPDCKTVLYTEELAKVACANADIIKITITAENCAVYEHKYYGEIQQCKKCFFIHGGNTKTDYNTWVAAKPETCEEDGYTAHFICSICKATDKNYEFKAKKGHDFYTADEIKYTTFYAKTWTKPTCEKDGEAEVWCKNNCGKTSKIVLPATGHELSEWFYMMYNCDKGTIAWRECVNERCDDREATYEEKVVQLPGKHDWKIIGGTLPTCTEYGIVDYRCGICGMYNYKNYVPANGHKLVEKTTAPTCTKGGKTVVTCENCDLKETIKLEATGHVETKEVVVTPATCTEKGSKNIVCVACEVVVKTEVIEALGHGDTTEKVTKPATCTEKGAADVICTVCEAKLSEKVLEALGHGKTTEKETKAPTCTEKGAADVICTVCEAKIDTKEIAALGHGKTETVVVKAPACEVAGVSNTVCTVCGAVLAEDSIDALTHKYGWIVVTKPSEAGSGRNEYKCDACGDVAEVKTIRYSKYYYNNTMTSFGPTTKELVGGNDWYRVTPVDVTVDGVYTYDLVASNRYVVGTVTITVNAGTLSVTYKVKGDVDVKDESLLIYASKADLAEGKAVTANVGADINVAETFGADAKVIVSLVLTGDYDAFGHNVTAMVVDAAEIAAMIANID